MPSEKSTSTTRSSPSGSEASTDQATGMPAIPSIGSSRDIVGARFGSSSVKMTAETPVTPIESVISASMVCVPTERNPAS